ncbi:MAG: NAD-dependent epimerase/dehydratase family protein [Dehalococcoidia bacterium]|nr:MAG: NAD-dependent epimerase/dehydratase family protein [Dehalococcoidia bacterium]
MKILVTGGAGFIGSNVVDAYIDLGHDVIVVDNLSTGFKRNLNPKAKFHELSIRGKDLSTVFQNERPDVVNHHAAQIDVSKSGDDPIADAEDNILGSLNLITNCVQSGVKRIIYASTGGAIYGEAEYLPADENHPINPVAQYGVSKHTVEHYLYLYHTLHGIDHVILRYANVYGPRQNPYGEAGVVAIFATQMLTGQQPTIFGSGDKTRDYVHVSDATEANILALERGTNTILNIGTGVETSDQRIFDTLAEVLGYNGSPNYAPVRKGEVYRIALECSKARQELGWSPRLSLKEGIAQTAEYYRDLARRSKDD